MNPTQEAAKSIFLEALNQPEEDRGAYLDTACGANVELRSKVEALLASHQQQDSFLDPRKLHPGSGHTQTSDFDDTSIRGERVRQSINSLAPWLTPSTQPHSLGRFLHYEVLEELGQGGFGIVYRVFDEKLHRVVALKVLSPTLASNPSARLRFLREARAAAAVRHEHVISIHAVDDEPLPHLVMEYISGQTLQQKIDKTGQMHLKEILRIGMQMAQGLAAAHKQGLIHRDIKPSNILLENGIERVKISDFGLARAVDDASISHHGSIVGTPAYMSPEQADGKPVDTRSDLFSLGSTLYAMCTGNSPFTADSTLATLKKVTERNPEPVSAVNRELPCWLDGIVSKLMTKMPDKRYQSAHEVADELATKLAMVQSPSTVIPPSRSRTWWAVASVILIAGIVLAFPERWGLTKLTPPIIKLFHHQLTLQLPSKDTIVEIWQTHDVVDNGKSMNRFSSGKFEPFITIVNKTNQTVALPPGNYWLLARLQGNTIERRLLKVGWGGSDSITLSAKPLNKVSTITDKTRQLEELVKLACEAKDLATTRYESGLVSHDHAMLATIKWWEARLELASDRQNKLEVRECLQQILDQQEARVRFAEKQVDAGMLTESDLIPLKQNLLKTKQRIQELK